MTEKTLDVAEVCELLGIHRATLHRRVKARKFPPPIPSGKGGALRWRAADVDKFLRVPGREGGAPVTVDALREIVREELERAFSRIG